MNSISIVRKFTNSAWGNIKAISTWKPSNYWVLQTALTKETTISNNRSKQSMTTFSMVQIESWETSDARLKSNKSFGKRPLKILPIQIVSKQRRISMPWKGTHSKDFRILLTLARNWKKSRLKRSSRKNRLIDHWLIFNRAIIPSKAWSIWAPIRPISGGLYKIPISIVIISRTKAALRIHTGPSTKADRQIQSSTNSSKNDNFPI